MSANHLRLCFRIEGSQWNAYAAPLATMEGAIFLGSIAIAMLDKQERIDVFKALIMDGYADLMHSITGQYCEIGPEHPAPEHERTKS